MKLTLPYPPSVNRYWRHVILGNRAATLLSGDARKFKKVVAGICLAERLRPIVGPVRIEIDVYRPRRVGDLDGILKGALDSLNGFAFEDDGQVVEILARRFDDKHNPRLEVTIDAVAR